MRDRQVFEEGRLLNGIRTYRYRDDSPYTKVTIQIPVGSAHSTEPLTPGIFHFLEHMCTLRSRRHPAFKEFKRLIGLKGGEFNARTGPLETAYEMEVPSRRLSEMIPGFFSLIFDPLFCDEDIALQRGIISSERRRSERWYPGRTELGHYVMTRWKWNCPLSLRQRVGTDEDLSTMAVESLTAVHRHYRDSRLWVMAGGSGDPQPLFDLLSGLDVTEHRLREHHEKLRWVNQTFHQHPFRDATRFVFRYGGLMVGATKPLPAIALNFILKYLTNHVHGPLYEWLREEKGWVYEMGRQLYVSDKDVDWELRFPLRNMEQVHIVQQELAERIRAALADEDRINMEVDRILDCTEAFGYPALSSILKDAERHLNDYGYIIPEKELLEHLGALRDRSLLQRTWDEYAAPERTGSFCAIPLDA